VLIALLAGLFFAGDLGTWNTSVFFTSAANATLLANMAPVFVGLSAMLFFKERLGKVFWAGLGVALVGAAMIMGEDLLESTGMLRGNLLASSAALFYGLYQLAVSRARQHGMDTLTVSWLANVSGGLALLAISLTLGHSLGGFTFRQWMALASMGVISQAVGYLAVNYALGKLPAPIVSASLLGQPVVTAITSIPLLGEGLSLIQIVGGLATLAGIYLVNQNRVKQPSDVHTKPPPA
jgi:drug/metabolite transporter (DMT)-like permease